MGRPGGGGAITPILPSFYPRLPFGVRGRRRRSNDPCATTHTEYQGDKTKDIETSANVARPRLSAEQRRRVWRADVWTCASYKIIAFFEWGHSTRKRGGNSEENNTKINRKEDRLKRRRRMRRKSIVENRQRNV